MFARTTAVLGLVAVAALSTSLLAQQPGDLVRKSVRTGPRFGVTWLSGSLTDTIKRRFGTDITPVITQFGWQFEKQFSSLEGGPVALNEFILLVGGLDQGTAIPSFTWLVGVRTQGEFEFGVGPNATPAGVALAVSVGQTFRAGALSLPVNIAIVPSRFGTRASILAGFNIYR
ncbi:MAG: hypothetical protein AABZ80_02465 [Gemmatimonadota bacterium]